MFIELRSVFATFYYALGHRTIEVDCQFQEPCAEEQPSQSQQLYKYDISKFARGVELVLGLGLGHVGTARHTVLRA